MQKMNADQKRLVEDNLNLVHHIVAREYPTFIHDDDIIQCGRYGLCKAALNWQDGKSAFSTYACKCIRNEICQELRSRKPHQEVLSLEHPIGDDLVLGDTIEGDNGIDYLDDYYFTQLTDLEQTVYQLRVDGNTPKEIAEFINEPVSKVWQTIRTMRYKYQNL